jgi:predicted metalloprotease
LKKGGGAWNGIFAASGQRYEEPRPMLFSNQLYLDLVFFRDLKSQLDAPVIHVLFVLNPRATTGPD